MSIRSRLLAATVVLVALGLVIASAATFTLLRSSLIDRIDEQLADTRLPALRILLDDGPVDGVPNPSSRPSRAGRPPPSALAQLLDRKGNVIATRSFGLAGPQTPPQLPPDLPGSENYSGEEPGQLFSARAVDSNFRYRVLAQVAGRRGGTIVVAFPLGDVDATLHNLLLVEILVSAAVLAGVAALAWWLVKLGLRPLEAMGGAADKIAAGNLSQRVEPANQTTEVGRLGIALNAMLDRIENAFSERRASEERLRRFVADASHELRTPLTSIRGYAELFDRGAKNRPADLDKSMQRIEEEAARMGRLVEDLLLLARLDQRRPLDRTQVDLKVLAQNVAADARAIQPRRTIRVEGPDTLVTEGDSERLSQVISNLVMNALTHTPINAAVHIRLASEDSVARLEVADEGPGMTPEQAERVFDRFYRADKSRSRASGNTGLGLSIAAAIVAAHNGSVQVDTSPGKGARFIVELPLKQPPNPTDPHN